MVLSLIFIGSLLYYFLPRPVFAVLLRQEDQAGFKSQIAPKPAEITGLSFHLPDKTGNYAHP